MANRRTGAARGRRGDPGSLSWRNDGVVLARLTHVEQLLHKGRSIAETAAELGVSTRTVVDDRARVRELWRESPLPDREERLRNLEYSRASLWRDYEELPLGSPYRPAVMGQITRIDHLMAEIDGSLGRGGRVQVNVTIPAEAYGPPLEVLYEQGKISEAEFRTGLRILALSSGEEQAASSVPAPRGLILDGEAEEVVPAALEAAITEPPAVASNGHSNGHRKVQRLTDMLDDEDLSA